MRGHQSCHDIGTGW